MITMAATGGNFEYLIVYLHIVGNISVKRETTYKSSTLCLSD
jgi:hypothetical protein